jgi:translation elongation factor EF-G
MMAQGVLCEEDMRGVRFSILDAVVHQDPAHRGPAQVLVAFFFLFLIVLMHEPECLAS